LVIGATALGCGLVVLTGFMVSRMSEPPAIAQVIAAPRSEVLDVDPLSTALALALATATSTATPMPPPTATLPFADLYSGCDPTRQTAGTYCVPRTPAVSPTAVPTCVPTGTTDLVSDDYLNSSYHPRIELCVWPGEWRDTQAKQETK